MRRLCIVLSHICLIYLFYSDTIYTGDIMFYIDDANICFQFENLNIKILRINMGTIESHFPMHHHGKSLYEFHFITSGKGSVIAFDTEYDLLPDTVYITGPFVPHEHIIDPSSPQTEFCIQMVITKKKSSPKSPIGDLLLNTTFWMSKDIHSIKPFLDLLDMESINQSIGYTEAAKSLIGLILVTIVRNLSGLDLSPSEYEKSTPDYNRMSIIEKSFFNDYATLTLSELAGRIKLSNRQTQRFLRKNYSKTFTRMLGEARSNKAKEFIREGISIKEAAILVGYDDIRSLKRKL